MRDNLTNLELVLNMLAEASTAEIFKKHQPKNFEANKKVTCAGGNVAGVARKSLEQQTGTNAVTPKNARNFLASKR